MDKKVTRLIICMLCILTLLLTGSCQSGAGPDTTAGTTAGSTVGSTTGAMATTTTAANKLPIVDKKITLKIFAAQTGYVTTTNWNELLIWAELEKRTNVQVEWKIVASDALAERRNLSIVSGDLPDVYLGAGFPSTDVVGYAKEGVFVALDELIQKNAPNIQQLLAKYPDIKKGITLPDGKIYSLPKASNNTNQSFFAKQWINKVWLQKVGLGMPKTLDEYYAMLSAFRTKDPNGNGQADEIPLTADVSTRFIYTLGGAFGLWNRGTQNGNIDYDETAGKLRFIPASDRYKELLQYLNKLYAENLLDHEYMTNKGATVWANLEKQIIGVFLFNHPTNAGKYIGDFEGLKTPLTGPYGDKIIPSVSGTVQSASAFIMTKSNAKPAETIKWLDYFMGDEGSELFYMGIKGQSYTINDKGEYHFTPEILKNPNGLDLNGALSKYTNWAGSNLPGLRQLKYVLDHGDGLPVAVDVTKALEPYFPKEIWNAFWFDAAESAKVSTLNADLTKYVNQMQNEFIIGRTSFAKWDEYLSTLEKLNVSEYMKLYQSAYERSYKK